VVFDIPKLPERRVYLTWQEGKGPDVVFEFTSKSTKRKDLGAKFELYRDTLRVREYFLFDPLAEYLHPPLQGFRRSGDQFVPIEPVDGRLPSEVLGLHLEWHQGELRLYDPATQQYLLSPRERREAQQRAEAAREQAEAAQQQAEAAQQREVAARQQAEAEAERLRRELEALRQQLPRTNQ
jgi:hypothetical protein